MPLKTCNRCGISKEETNYRIYLRTGKLRNVCSQCQNEQVKIKRKQRLIEDDGYFWLTRCRAFNKPNKRRSKTANEAIKEPIPIVLLKDKYCQNKKCYYCKIELEKKRNSI